MADPILEFSLKNFFCRKIKKLTNLSSAVPKTAACLFPFSQATFLIVQNLQQRVGGGGALRPRG
jgi:hypothetical protein